MKIKKLNGWERIAIILSAGWLLFSTWNIASIYHNTNFFDLFDTKSCSDFYETRFFIWYDKVTDRPINDLLYKEIQKLSNPTDTNWQRCDDVDKAKKIIQDEITRDVVKPKIHPEYLELAAFLLTPIILLWLIAYLTVLIIKWIIRGFITTK